MKPPAGRIAGCYLAILVEGALGVVALVLGWIFSVPLREQFGADAREFGRGALLGVVATVPLLAMFWWLIRADWPAARRLRQQVEQLIGELFPQASIWQLMAVAAVAGVGEELLFRGAIQPLVARWSTPIAGLAVASVIFGVFHAVSPLYFALATLVGAYFGGIVLVGRDLVPAIVAHSLYDCIALVYLSHAMIALDATRAIPPEEEHEWTGD
jgi:membrane protease YdiL (CAAX protease family)